jgi:hypothetical protein
MIPFLLLIASIILLRIAPWVAGGEVLKAAAGYAPVMALAVCSGSFLSRRLAWVVAVVAAVVPHFVINLSHGYGIGAAHLWVLVVASAAAVALGAAVKAKATVVPVVGATLFSTVLFYLLSNTVSFFSGVGYAPTLGGWWQCVTTGLPEFAPQTWVFGVRQLAGDVGFAVMFWALCRRSVSQTVAASGMSPARSV